MVLCGVGGGVCRMAEGEGGDCGVVWFVGVFACRVVDHYYSLVMMAMKT